MPKSYQTILRMLLDNDVQYSRWFTIGSTFFIAPDRTIDEKEKERIKALFVECEYLQAYNNFAIDMDKQPGSDPISEETAKKYKDPKRVKNIDFEL